MRTNAYPGATRQIRRSRPLRSQRARPRLPAYAVDYRIGRAEGSNPLHVIVMVAVMLALMALVMMILR
jgi:hypothetical protein